ncbi:MAG: tRNA pseudouridine(38-40) synthase TruA [Candidatus Ancaeobacter aquaticus]|nr:tRNA pseudouridine(38-40) synthase TruA [Candidatus Ancaeobacter aquaticus]
MRNLKLTIEYDGTHHCGWQIQPKDRTVMQEIQRAIKKLTKETPKIEYSSRTDSGVHAYGQAISFKTKSRLPLKNIQMGLNSYLPDDTRVVKAEEAKIDFNARFDAKAKHYRYIISDTQIAPAIHRDYMYHFKLCRLNERKMLSAVKYMVGTHDFSSFSADSGEDQGSPIKKIIYLKIKRKGDIITIDIKGSGFLYKMVRSIVGALIEVGRGKITPNDIKKLLELKKRSMTVPTAPSQGLYLVKVFY